MKIFGREEQRRIDLHLPRGWNQCTTDELEIIAAAIIQEQMRCGRYRVFSWQRVLVGIVLGINRLNIVEEADTEPAADPDAQQSTFLLQREGDREPFPLTAGQMVALCEMLSWLQDEQPAQPLFLFPYQTLDVRCMKDEGRSKREEGRSKRDDGRGEREEGRSIGHHTSYILHLTSSITHHPSSIIHLQGPPPLLDGYTWHEYRILSDWMQEYMRLQNAMAQSKKEDVRSKTQAALDRARNEFLAVLFRPKEGTSSITHLTSDIFTSFSPVQWQVVLFWWSALMQQLQRKFPKVFKTQSVGKGKARRQPGQDSPWDFYNRVTATIQKYIGGLSEQDVNSATYGTILQQLEMMADEAAEMERLKRKSK